MSIAIIILPFQFAKTGMVIKQGRQPVASSMQSQHWQHPIKVRMCASDQQKWVQNSADYLCLFDALLD